MIWKMFRGYGPQRAVPRAAMRTRLAIEHLEQRQLLSGNNTFTDVLAPPADDELVGQACPDVGGGQEQGLDQALVDRALALVGTIQDGLYRRGQAASDEQLLALVAVGQEVWQRIQDPGDQNVRTLVEVQGALANALDQALLARWLTAGSEEGGNGQAVERRLDAFQLSAEFSQIFSGLYQGVLPADDRALIGAGLSLAEEIRRVADESPGSRYLIELGWAQANLAYTLDAVQIALRAAPEGPADISPGENGDPGGTRLPLAEHTALLRQVFMDLYQGKQPNAGEFLNLVEIGDNLGREIQRVANEAPGSDYLIQLGLAHGELAYIFDRVLLARLVLTGPKNLDTGENQGENLAGRQGQLGLLLSDEDGALLADIRAKVSDGRMPAPADISELGRMADLLGREIQRVATDEPGNLNALVELSLARGSVASVLTQALLVWRVAGQPAAPVTDNDPPAVNDPDVPENPDEFMNDLGRSDMLAVAIALTDEEDKEVSLPEPGNSFETPAQGAQEDFNSVP